MEPRLLTLVLVCISGVSSAGWDEIVVGQEDAPVTLPCNHSTTRGPVGVVWTSRPLQEDNLKLVLSSNERMEVSASSSKPPMRLVDHLYRDSGNFSLLFHPRAEDGGLYICMVQENQRPLMQRVILLVVLTVSLRPSGPLPEHSTLCLTSRLSPSMEKLSVAWTGPAGFPIRTERNDNCTKAKVPRVDRSDHGTYVCRVHQRGWTAPLYSFKVEVLVADGTVASFRDVIYGEEISAAAAAQTDFLLRCPRMQGDYVRLSWKPPDTKLQMTVYLYDRWKDFTLVTSKSHRLKLAGPPHNHEEGRFAFLLTTNRTYAGMYTCEVFLDDHAFIQRTVLTVIKVKLRQLPLKKELVCYYSEKSQVRSVRWTHEDPERRLRVYSNGPGAITLVLQPITGQDINGNYTCTLVLKNGVRVSSSITVRPPKTESPPATSLHPSLSALLLLVPLAAGAVGVLLWRRKHTSNRGGPQSLTIPSGEVENIYENPEDLRQDIYMDLKPREADDVYKELER